MPTLEQLAQEVDRLDSLSSSIFRFRDALRHIQEASQSDDGDRLQVGEILSRFRGKLPDLVTYNRIRAEVKDLADDLMIAALTERIAKINARNLALSRLTGALTSEISRVNTDAALLTSIKEGIEKATKTVNEAKGIVDSLTATDKPTKDRLKELIEGLGGISNILHPPSA